MRIVRVLLPAFAALIGLSSILTAYAGSLIQLSSAVHENSAPRVDLAVPSPC